MKLKDLFKNILNWAKDKVVTARVENTDSGYSWFYKSLSYDQEAGYKEAQTFFDRTEANEQYIKDYKETNVKNKKAYGWNQAEINLIAGVHKCFVTRYQTRLQCYRNDLSMKGARMRSSVNIALGKLEARKKAAEKSN